MEADVNYCSADVTHPLTQGRSERLMNGGVQLKNFRIAWNISEQNSSQYLV